MGTDGTAPALKPRRYFLLETQERSAHFHNNLHFMVEYDPSTGKYEILSTGTNTFIDGAEVAWLNLRAAFDLMNEVHNSTMSSRPANLGALRTATQAALDALDTYEEWREKHRYRTIDEEHTQRMDARGTIFALWHSTALQHGPPNRWGEWTGAFMARGGMGYSEAVAAAKAERLALQNAPECTFVSVHGMDRTQGGEGHGHEG